MTTKKTNQSKSKLTKKELISKIIKKKGRQKFLSENQKKYYEILKNTKVSILVLTNFHKSYLEKNGFRNIFVHPNYLDLVISEENDKHSEEDYILYAGRISEEKGVDELIDAFIIISV